MKYFNFARHLAIVSTSIGMVSSAHAQEPTTLDAATLMTVMDGAVPQGTLAVQVAQGAYEALSAVQTVEITKFLLTPTLSVDLELERVWAWGPATQFVVGTNQGDVQMQAPDLVFFRGVVSGAPESRVFLSASPAGLKGVIRVGQSQFIVSPAGVQENLALARTHWIFDSLSQAAATPPVRFECEPAVVPGQVLPPANGVPGFQERGASRVALVAIDADFEFRQFFTTPEDAASYVCELIGYVSYIYEADVNLKLAPSFIRVWDTASDPYTGTNTSTQLDQFKNFWESNMGSVTRNTAHLVSGRNLGGGRAFLDNMCGGSSAYGVNANMSGFFPRPPQNGGSSNWDLVVVAHELGHNFSSPHTHCYDPPIDRCYTEEGGCAGGTAVCQQGTIMSYCHTCSGGLANIDLTFGPTVSNHLQSNLVPCIGASRNPCFVNASFTGLQQGTPSNPMRTIARATWFVAPGGTVSIAAGSYPETLRICQPMRLTSTGGIASFGR
jgi:hypothetical protein